MAIKSESVVSSAEQVHYHLPSLSQNMLLACSCMQVRRESLSCLLEQEGLQWMDVFLWWRLSPRKLL